MAISVTTDLTTISACDAVTGWADVISNFAVETGGINIEGSGSLCAWIDATTSAVEYYTITSADYSNGEHVYIWMYCSGKVDTLALGGFRIVLYTDASNYATFYVGGNDTHKAQWNLVYCDVSAAPDDEVGTFDPSDVTRIGVQFKTLTNAVKKGQTYVQNCFWDAVRIGTGFTVTSGATDQITFQDIVDWDEGATTRWYGIVQQVYGAYLINGMLTFGDTSTASIDFIGEGEVVLYQDNALVASTLNTIQVLGNGTGTTNFELTGSFIKANNVQCILDLDGSNLDDIDVVGNSFVNVNTTFTSTQTITNNVFSGCTQVVPGQSTFENNTIKETIATDAGMLWPDGTSTLSDCVFLDNTTGAGIEHTASGGSPFAYDNLTFDGNTYDVNNTSGSEIDVNKNNGSDPSTYTGSVVNFLGASVTTEITARNASTTDLIEGARVLIWPTDGTNFPYQVSVAIVSSGTTATVTHSAHGLATGDNVIIAGANEDAYNGAYTITYGSSTTYTYTMTEDPVDTATGTITSTFAFINEATNASGIANDSRIVGTDQPVTGWARKGGSTPLFQQAPITGTVDSATGLSLTVQMIPDE